MNQHAPNPVTQINVAYVNERKDRRPPNIKDDQGNFFTLSDAAYPIALGWKGQTITLEYYVNGGGYSVATAINGQQLPKDPRNNAPQQGPGYNPNGSQRPPGTYLPPQQPQQAPAAAQTPSVLVSPKMVRMQCYTQIAVACIESGGDEATFDRWVRKLGSSLSGQSAYVPPQTTQPAAQQQPPPPQPEQTEQQQQHEAAHQAQAPQGDELPFDDDIPF